MARVNTLRGPVDSSELGYTLAHEHVFVHDEGVISNFPHIWDEDRAFSLARMKVMAAYECGVRTMLDASVLGNGRNVPMLLRAVGGLPMNFLICTGLFYKSDLPGFFQTQSPDILAECFIKDIEEGIAGTGVKAAIIKSCTDVAGITIGVEKALRAAARAHLRTGAVLHTHANAVVKAGLEQQRIFADEGVDLEKVYIGHAINSPDIDYLHALLDKGSFIGFDRWAAGPLPPIPGLEVLPPVTADDAVKMLAQLCREGYAGQILIGNDGCSFQTVVRFVNVEESPGMNDLDYVVFPKEITPKLLAAGVTESQIDTMTIHAPRRLFEINAR